MIYEHIVVAIDGSETAKIALHEAIKFAKDSANTKLHLLHVIDAIYVNWSMQPICPLDVVESLRNAGKDILEEARTQLRHLGVKKMETHLVELNQAEKRIADKIVEAAISVNADLIIIGTHGRRGVNLLVMGSVAIGIIKISPIPVLLIRGQAK
ncbi:MAG: universal stress protein [Proteobacteria bacterium]|nr:universal stress protein [Pseudomonadota bacterium]